MRWAIVIVSCFLVTGCKDDGSVPGQYAGRPVTAWLEDLGAPDTSVRKKAADAFIEMGPLAIPATDALVTALKEEADPRVAVRLAVAIVKANSTLSADDEALAVERMSAWIAEHPYSEETVQIATISRAPALSERAMPLLEALNEVATANPSDLQNLSPAQRALQARVRQAYNP